MRTQTPPEIKWILVERATLAGDMGQLEKRGTLVEAEISRVHGLIAALDTSIHLLEQRVHPGAAGRVQRHRQNDGRRGAFKAFVVQALRHAADAGLSAK